MLLRYKAALLSISLQFFVASAFILKLLNSLKVIALLLSGFDKANVVLVT
jgi:hypothetical protein